MWYIKIIYSNNSSIERYLSPLSGKIAIILLPLFSSLLANCKAAQVAAPEEIPGKIPSFWARATKVLRASTVGTGIISSITSESKIDGTKPAPIPWIPCGPLTPFPKVWDSSGSTATIFTSGRTSFNALPIPVTVPPVPTPATT